MKKHCKPSPQASLQASTNLGMLLLCFIIPFLSITSRATADDFFSIEHIVSKESPPRIEGDAYWLQLDGHPYPWKENIFIPYLEVQIKTAEQYEAKDTFIHIHFFDSDNKLIETGSTPVMAWLSIKNSHKKQIESVLFPANQPQSLFFPLPSALVGKPWSAIVVFGDQNSATAQIYPSATSMFGMDYPERSLVEQGITKHITRTTAINPVTEVAVKTINPKQPTITLFMRLPLGATQGSQAKGVLALSLLANDPTQIRQMLQGLDHDQDPAIFSDMTKAFQILKPRIDSQTSSQLEARLTNHHSEDDAFLVQAMQDSLKTLVIQDSDKDLNICQNLLGQLAGRIWLNNLAKFANHHQLAILAWGARRLWNPKLSYDEQSSQINHEMDQTFDDIANAWEHGVDQISRDYGFPNHNFLLCGFSGAAQYACRLALRKPDRFLAVHVHIPSSFDQPTPDANKVLWLLTTGEREGGYPAAQRFFNACKGLGYPIVFKAIPGLGHAGNPIADHLGMIFFEYALTLQNQRQILDEQSSSSASSPNLAQNAKPWPESFSHPNAIADILNQDVFSPEETGLVPENLKVILPTASIARAWLQQ